MVDTDFVVPTELDTVVIVVEGPSMAETPVRVALDSVELPVTLGLVHRGGALGPVTVSAHGELDGTERVVRATRTSFVLHQRRELRLELLRQCAGAVCVVPDTTCAGGGCTAVVVPPDTLPGVIGVPARSDVGPPPVDACVVLGTELCDGRDEDCDGRIDEGTCVCDPPCSLDRATARCEAGVCVIASCRDGFGDCDELAANGCEIDLAEDARHCGACGVRCRGGAECVDGACD